MQNKVAERVLTESTKGYLMVAGAGVLWGMVGFFGKSLFKYDLASEVVSFWRMMLSCFAVLSYILIKDKKLLRIDKKGLIYCALIGFICQTLFNIFYFTSIDRTTISTAVVLLYTAPIFVIILSRVLYKELLTPIKIVALLLCIIGCFYTVTGGNIEVLKLNLLGVLTGVGAGFTYGLLPILGKNIFQRYNRWTTTFYMMGFGALFILPYSNPINVLSIDSNLHIWLNLLGLGILSTAAPYVLFSNGISYGIETSKASIICTIEVVVAVIVSFLFFNESIVGWKFIGILLVILSVGILQCDKYLITKFKGKI